MDGGHKLRGLRGQAGHSSPQPCGEAVLSCAENSGHISAQQHTGQLGQDWDFIIQKSTLAFDEVADRISQSSTDMKKLLGDVLTQLAVIFREIRSEVTPYFL